MMALSTQLDEIQQKIILIHRELFQESPTPMKLQKLCYYAQGYSLARGNELFPEEFEAWQHGPVIRVLYEQYCDYQWRQITEEIEEQATASLSNNDFLNDIVSAYGQYDGAALSTMTHREKPWLDARNGIDELSSCSEIISKESLKDFFAHKLKTYA